MRFYGLQQAHKNMQKSHVFIAPSISPDFPAGCFLEHWLKRDPNFTWKRNRRSSSLPDPIHASDCAGQVFRVPIQTILPILTSLEFCLRIHFLALAFGQNKKGTHLSKTYSQPCWPCIAWGLSNSGTRRCLITDKLWEPRPLDMTLLDPLSLGSASCSSPLHGSCQI